MVRQMIPFPLLSPGLWRERGGPFHGPTRTRVCRLCRPTPPLDRSLGGTAARLAAQAVSVPSLRSARGARTNRLRAPRAERRGTCRVPHRCAHPGGATQSRTRCGGTVQDRGKASPRTSAGASDGASVPRAGGGTRIAGRRRSWLRHLGLRVGVGCRVFSRVPPARVDSEPRVQKSNLVMLSLL